MDIVKRYIYQKYFSEKQLKLAWERMIRSNRSDVKDYWGIEVYGINLDANLQKLSDKLLNGEFKPDRPFKYYEPKASGTHRTKTVLPIEDALVYQAIANSVATANYSMLHENSNFVFGSVLHPEVARGEDILQEENSEFYFFQYYIPLFNDFAESVNREIEDAHVKYKLETDITGFFDSIPHSKLLIKLNDYGVESEILEILEDCLNIYSGTRESITPGIGIPQGQAPSFFLANILLTELDREMSQMGMTYYRYMDDIRIYDEDRDMLMEALVKIDNHLKGLGLSLNSKKTSVEEITNRQDSKIKPLYISVIEDDYNHTLKQHIEETKKLKFDLIEKSSSEVSEVNFTIEALSDEELIKFCTNEIKETETFLITKFYGNQNLPKMFQPEGVKEILNDDEVKNELIHYTYRWRSANSVLNEFDKPILNEDLIPVWLFAIEHFFWKANHFCWNLNQYGQNEDIKKKLFEIEAKKTLQKYEWVRYQIWSNMASCQSFSRSELKLIFRNIKEELSPLVRLGKYLVLAQNLEKDTQLFDSFKQSVKEEPNAFIKNNLSGFIKRGNDYDVIKYWFGL